VGIGDWSRIEPDRPLAISPEAGTLALDGERELELAKDDRATVTLRTAGFQSIDVGKVMRWAAATGEFFTRAQASLAPRKEQ
jgi:hypothetical protein